MASFLGQDPLNSLTNLYSRPILINALRDPRDIGDYPTSADIQPPGTQWENSSTTPATLWKTAGNGYWYKGDSQNLSKLTGNTGEATPDADQNINIVGTTGQIDVVGSGSTLTLSLTGGGTAIDSFAPDTGTSPVVPNASGLVNVKGQTVASVSGIRVTGALNELDIAMFSPFEGDFSFTQSSTSSASPRQVSVTNADTANATSHAQFIATTGGTSSGNPMSLWSISGGTTWSAGTDRANSSAWKLSLGSSLGTSDAIQVATSGNTTISLGDLSVSRSASGSAVVSTISNTSNTASSSAQLSLSVAGTSAADPSILWAVSGTTSWIQGIDNSDSDKFVLSASSALGTTSVMEWETNGFVNCILGNFRAIRAASGSVVTVEANNSSNTAASDAMLLATVGGESGGNPYVRYNVADIQQWSHGIVNTASATDSFAIAHSTDLRSNVMLTITTAGNVIVPMLSVGSAGAPTITSGSGAPGSSQPKGSLYLRTDGSGVNDRAYIATDAVGTWTAIVTVA